MPFKLGAIVAAIKLDTAQFNAAIKQVQGQTTTAAKGATGAGTAFGGMWKKLAMGVGIVGGVTMAVRAVINQFKDVVAIGREFESTWANVTTMMDSTADEARDMRDELVNLSPTLGDTTKLAEGLYQVLSASIPKEAAIIFLEEAAIAAKAGVTDVKIAVDALTTVINAYGLEAETANELSDVMFQTVKRGKLTYEELANSLGTIIPVAATTGVKFTEVSAAIASLTRQGIPAGTATMQLRQTLMAVLKPTDAAKELMGELGISYGQSALKAHGLSGFLVELREKTQGNADTMAEIVPNVRALTGVMALAGSGAEGFATDIGLMDDALIKGGQTTEAFDKQMVTFDATLETLTTAIDKTKISLYDGLVAGFENAIPTAKEFDGITKDLNQTFKDLGETIGETIGTIIKHFDSLKAASKGPGGWALAITDSLLGVDEKLKSLEETGKTTAINFKKSLMVLDVPLEKIREELEKGEGSFLKWAAGIKASDIEAAKAKDSYFGLGGEIKKTAEYLRDQVSWIIASSDTAEEARERIEDFYEANKELSKTLKEQKGEGENLIPVIKTYVEEVDTAIESTKGVMVATSAWEAEVLSLKTILDNARNSLHGFAYEEAIPAARDIDEAWKTATDNMESHVFDFGEGTKDINDDIAEDAETTVQELNTHWQAFVSGAGVIVGDFFWDLTDKSTTFDEVITNMLNSWLDLFRSIVADMLQEWTTNFIKGVIESSAEAGASIAKNIGESLSGAGAESVAAGIKVAAKSVSAVVDTISGVITAVATVAALFKKQGPSSTDSWHFQETWKESKRATDYLMINQQKRLDEMTKALTGTLPDKTDATRKVIRAGNSFLKDIRQNTAKMANILAKTKGAQAGAVSFNTELLMTHGTRDKPEYVIPHDDLQRMMSPASGGGGGGRVSISNQFSIVVKDQIDPYAAQRITREVVIPQVIAALETNVYNREFQEKLGIAR